MSNPKTPHVRVDEQCIQLAISIRSMFHGCKSANFATPLRHEYSTCSNLCDRQFDSIGVGQ